LSKSDYPRELDGRLILTHQNSR